MTTPKIPAPCVYCDTFLIDCHACPDERIMDAALLKMKNFIPLRTEEPEGTPRVVKPLTHRN